MVETRVGADGLGLAVKKILEKYNEVVFDNVDEVAKKTAYAGRRALKAASKQLDERWGNEVYSTGWRTQHKRDLWFTKYIIYQSKEPGLTHLLELGHELNIGGRTKAYPHIQPIREMLTKDFSRESIDAIRRS